MPILPGSLISSPETLYDTELILNTSFEMFTEPWGTKDLGGEFKNLHKTNMYFPQRLPCPQKFLIDRLYCVIQDAQGVLIPLFSDKAELWSAIHLNLKVSLRVVREGPAWSFAHPNIVFAGLRKAKMAPLLSRWERRQARPFDLMIEQLQQFSVSVSCLKPCRETYIVVMLQGQLWRYLA